MFVLQPINSLTLGQGDKISGTRTIDIDLERTQTIDIDLERTQTIDNDIDLERGHRP